MSGLNNVSSSVPHRSYKIPLLLFLSLAIIIAIVLVIIFIPSPNTSSTKHSSSTIEYGSLKYIPYNRIEDLTDRGYIVILGVLRNFSISQTSPSIQNISTGFEIFIMASVYTKDASRGLYLIGIKGSNNLLVSEAMWGDLKDLLKKNPSLREGYRVWIDYQLRTIIISNNIGNIVVNIKYDNMSPDYVIDTGIVFAKILEKGDGWSSKDIELNKLINNVPKRYLNANVVLYKSLDKIAILFTRYELSLSPISEGIGGYMIISKNLEEKLKAESYTVINETKNYLLIRGESLSLSVELPVKTYTQQDTIVIQDATLSVLHKADYMQVYLQITLKNQGDKVARITGITVDNYNISGFTYAIIDPGSTYSFSGVVMVTPTGIITDPVLQERWEVGTEHLIKITYDVIGGSSGQVITARVRAT